MNARNFRWGVLGTGNIAGQFCRDLKALPEHELVSVASRSADRAAAFCREFGGTAIDGYENLLDDPSLDGVYLSLPNSMHAEWTIKTLRAGLAVLCEKPLATSLTDAETMFAAAEKAKKPLVEAFMYRCTPQTAKLLEMLRAGVIGTVTHVRVAFSYRTTNIDGNVRFDHALGGGALLDVGCYCLDFACLLADAPVKRATANQRMHERGVDVMTSGLIEFENGIAATFVCGMDTPTDNAAVISGTEGYITLEWPWKPREQAGFTIHRGIPPKQDLKPGQPAVAPPPQFVSTPSDLPLYALEAEAFAAHVRDGGPAFMPEVDSLRLAGLIDTVRASAGASC